MATLSKRELIRVLAVITTTVTVLLFTIGLVVGSLWLSDPNRKEMEPILVLIGLILSLLVPLVAYLIDCYREAAFDGQDKSIESNPLKLGRQHLLVQARLLTAYLDKLDDETGWNQRGFLDPEAQVDEQVAELGQGGRIRRVGALLRILHKSRKHNLFLLLGDPGSGKSVALRQCARRWLETEIHQTNTIPLYLNLREWLRDPNWSDLGLPSEEEVDVSLRAFAKETLREKVRSHFLADHFDTLHASARFFLLLDSFDEIPAVLDVRERGPLINALSKGLQFFITGGNAARGAKRPYAGRGVLASRLYRAPTIGFQESCRLEIRPFGDGVLRDLLHNHGISRSVADRFLGEHRGLAEAARNPFTAQLFASYIKKHVQEGASDPLPHSRAEAYQYFVNEQLKRAVEALAHTPHGASSDELRRGLDQLAKHLFASANGFDLPVAVLTDLWADRAKREAWLAGLAHVHLIRWERGSLLIGFAHRRFAEYFAACALSDDQARTHFDHLGSANGLWRDVLVVYCELATEGTLSGVIAYAWEIARPLVQQDTAHEIIRARAQNALRFLLEAVRGRTDSMAEYQSALAAYVERTVRDPENDLLRARETAELTGLLIGDALEIAMLAVLERGNWWVLEAALHSCRYQRTPGRKILNKFCRAIDETTPLRLFDSNGIVASLRFSSGLREVWRYAQGAKWNIVSSIACMIIALSLNWVTILFAGFHVFQATVRSSLSQKADNKKSRMPAWLTKLRQYPDKTAVVDLLVSRLLLLVMLVAQINLYFKPNTRDLPFQVLPPTNIQLVALFVCSVLVLPIPEMFAFRNLVYSLGTFGCFSVVCLAIFSLLYLGLKMAGVTKPDFVTDVLSDVWTYLCLAAAGCLVFGSIRYGWRWFCDLLYFFSEMAFPDRRTTRLEIARIFRSIKTGYWRLRFVERLEREAVVARDPWPGGRGPGTGNHAADQRLSALDERWREEEEREGPDL